MRLAFESLSGTESTLRNGLTRSPRQDTNRTSTKESSPPSTCFASTLRRSGILGAYLPRLKFVCTRATKRGFQDTRLLRIILGTRLGLVRAFAEWARLNDEFDDLVKLLPDPSDEENSATPAHSFVYLIKSGDHFKIGRSDNVERRVRQISVSLPEAVTLEYAIRTDDPVGIEAYWHRRFENRRAKGEWFRLTVADVRAFKRRRFH